MGQLLRITSCTDRPISARLGSTTEPSHGTETPGQ